MTAVTFNFAAIATTPAVLIGADLEPQRISVQSLRDGVLHYFDADRNLRSEPIDRFLQLRQINNGAQQRGRDAGEPTPSVIELIDGQRLVGKLTGADDAGQTLYWSHPLLGEVRVRLKDTAALLLDGSLGPVAAAAADVVLLTNGDRLEGFVVTIHSDALRFQPPGGAGPALDLPMSRVGAVILANPLTPPRDRSTDTHMVHLTDGSRLLARNIEIARDRLTMRTMLHTDAPESGIELAHIRRIDVASADSRLVDLADRPYEVVAGGEVFTLPMPPRTVGSAIWMHAPVTVRYQLPPGTTRFAANAHLADDVHDPARSVVPGRFIVRLYVDGAPAGRYEIGGDQPGKGRPVRINLPVKPGSSGLTIELDPAAGGPVLDRLVLRNAVLLVAVQRAK
ncbi:MAG: hypothetical protein V3U29_00145 [Phycisphaeraceae bacterium]